MQATQCICICMNVTCVLKIKNFYFSLAVYAGMVPLRLCQHNCATQRQVVLSSVYF